MLAKRPSFLLDSYISALVGVALDEVQSRDERSELLRQASALGRQVFKGPIQAHLLDALERGEAPRSFDALRREVESEHRRLMRSLLLRRPLVGGRSTAAERSQAYESLLTPGEVARELGVSSKTVTNWCKKGLLRFEVLESGHRRIPASALAAYREGQARWERLDATVQHASGQAPAPDEEAIFAELAERHGK